MKKLTKILIIPLLVLSLAGCGKIPVLENGQEAVVTLKEGDISAEDLYSSLKNAYSKFIISDLIDSIIFNAKYKETDEEKKHIESFIKDVETTAKNYGYTTLGFIQTNYGYATIDEFKEAISLNYKRDLAIKDYLKEEISDKEIEKYYKNNIYGNIEVSHILISPETLDGMTAEEKQEKQDEALKLAKEIIKKLNKGEKFADLAKKYSDDTATASKGGSLGFISTKDNYLDEFKDAAFALKKGKYTTTPVETQYGYHIIYKTDEKAKPSLKDSKEDIIDSIVEKKLENESTLYYTTLEKIRKESDLKIVDSELNKIYDEYMKSLIEKAKAKSATSK